MERKDPLRKHAAPTPSRGYIASCAVKCDAQQYAVLHVQQSYDAAK
jgi:hypothetical protein